MQNLTDTKYLNYLDIAAITLTLVLILLLAGCGGSSSTDAATTATTIDTTCAKAAVIFVSIASNTAH